jgi:outer membrane protein
MISLHRIAWTCLMALALCLGGCSDFGTGGTGERVIPRQTLRTITPANLQALATTQPITAATTRPAIAQLPLSIEECRQLALSNNLDLQIQLYNPTLAKESLSEEEARFEALFTSNINYAGIDAPTFTELTGTTGNSLNAAAGVTLPLQTGGAISFNAPISRNETNNSFSILNPAYTSNYVFAISHPLLRGFGLETNSHPIRLAFYAYQQTEARTKLEIIRILADVDRTYWRLYAARRALEVRKQQYDLAIQQLERAKRQVRAGTVAEVEIVRAEAGVSDQLEQVILAEQQLRDRQRELKRVLRKQDLGLDSPVAIVPVTEPSALFIRLDRQRTIAIAQKQRMEMLDLELQILADTSSVSAARNGTLPLLSVDYAYNLNGLGPSLDESFSQVNSNKFSDSQLGLRMEVPIGNEAARSRLRRALTARMQTLSTRDQRLLQIEQEVLVAIDTLDANWQRILAARQRVVLNARLADLEARQFTQGLRTSTDVLDAQTKLADAQTSEIVAVTEYQIAQVDIAFATGTLMGAGHIVWTPAPRAKE